MMFTPLPPVTPELLRTSSSPSSMLLDRPTDTSPPISGPRLSLLPPPSPPTLRNSRPTPNVDPRREVMAEEETAEAVAAEEVAEAVETDLPETEKYDTRRTIYTSAVSSAC